MTDNKKESTNDFVKQLSGYKTSKLAELGSDISREKTRAAVIMTSIRAKKEFLFEKAEFESTPHDDESRPTFDEPKIANVLESDEALKSRKKEKPIVKEIENPTNENKDVVNKVVAEAVKPSEVAPIFVAEKEKVQNTEHMEEIKVTKQPKIDEKKPVANKTVAQAPKAKPLESEKKPTIETKNSAEGTTPQPEILPNGEVRRIYVPPAPVVKSKVQTRVFGQNGYQNNRTPRPNGAPNGAPNGTPNGAPGGYRGNNYQGGGGYQGNNYQGGGGYQGNNQSGGGYQGNNYQGQRPPMGARPSRPTLGGYIPVPSQFPPTKTAPQKGKVTKPNGSTAPARFDDHSALNKRALMKKGYVIDSTIAIDDDDVKVRNFRAIKNRAGGNSSTIYIDHAIITTDPVAIKVLSDKIGKSGAEIIKTLFLLGIIKTINENVDFATAELIAGEHDITLEYKPDVNFEDKLEAKRVFDNEEEQDKLVARPPIVTIMGHVDHGKTSLLDYIRKSHVTSGEAGGITQHIGAYTVSLKGNPITFLDTPGHEAFTSMRARGAQVTDIAVLVVAADDGIMPQTIEAIHHARQANVPIIVAVNKMDKNGANPDRILQQLTEHEVLPEEWGGETPVVKVSAKTGDGIDNLLENILTLAELKELKANVNRNARGTIIEARLDKGLGKVATILVQTGTLHIGDVIVAGICTGKIRAMIDDKGKYVKKAGPSTPVSVTGWDDVPEAGDIIDVVADEKFARELALERKTKLGGVDAETNAVSLNDLFDKIKKGELKSVKLIIKADVQGSVEAVKQSLSKLGNEEVDIDIIHGAVGAIKESDVSLADTAKAIIIGFNVKPDANARVLALQKKIDIRFYDIIYNAIEDIEKAVKGLLEPKFKEVVLGSAEVRELFKITGVGTIAGSHVTDGKIIRGAKARLVRDGKVEYTGEIESLRHNKDNVKEMAKNFDCGIMLVNYMDVKLGDVIEAFQMEKIVDEA